MNKYECPEKIYKYVSFDGLLKTLQHQTVRFSRPCDFNDPFDMYLQEALGKEVKDFAEDMKTAFHDFVSKETDYTSLPDGPFKRWILLINEGIKRATPDQKEIVRKEMLDTPIEEMFDMERLKKINQEIISHTQKSFKNDGVFCSTTDFENLLMWAHYADQHRGAVLEFTPNKEKDSVFLASRKVTYSDERPLLYASAQDMALHGFTMSSEESTKLILDRLIFTKSREWKYEQEYRLFIPSLIKEDQPFAPLRYHPEELTGIFLGCRTNEKHQGLAISLAKGVNENVGIYVASILPRKFKLDFKKL